MENGVMAESKKSNETMKEVKKTFRELAQMLSRVSSAKELVNATPGFSELFAKTYLCLGKLEKECIQYKPGVYSFYDAILSIVENVDIVQSGVEQELVEMYKELNERIKATREVLKELNVRLNSENKGVEK